MFYWLSNQSVDSIMAGFTRMKRRLNALAAAKRLEAEAHDKMVAFYNKLKGDANAEIIKAQNAIAKLESAFDI